MTSATSTTSATSPQTDPTGMFGAGTLIAYYVTNLVGAGILVIPAIALETAGPWSVLAWLVLGIGSWPLARVFAAIAIDFPDANGVLRFVGEALGKRLRDSLTLVFLVAMVVGNPIVALVAARYLVTGLGLSGDLYYPVVFAVMAANVGFNLMGLRMGSQVQRILLVLTIGVLFVAVGSALPAADPARLSAVPFAADELFAAMAVGFFTFLGWENVCTIAPNVRNPKASFRRAIAVSVPLIGGLYVGIALVLALSVPVDGISGDYAVLNLLMQSGSSPATTQVANLVGFLVVFLSGNAWVLAGGKLCSAAARDGLLPRALAKGTETTPRRAFLAMGSAYFAVIFTLQALGENEAVIVEFVSAIFICVYLITMGAVCRHYTQGYMRALAVISFLIIAVFAYGILLKTLIVLAMLGLVFAARSARERLRLAAGSGGAGSLSWPRQ
jgi:amino acid efflux transporter